MPIDLETQEQLNKTRISIQKLNKAIDDLKNRKKKKANRVTDKPKKDKVAQP